MFDAVSPLAPVYALPAAGVLALLLVARARRRAIAIEGTALRDVELGALLVVAGTATALRVDGSLDGRTFPLVFVAGRGTRLPLVGAAVLAIHVPLAFAGQALAGLEGLAVALAVPPK